MVADVIRETSLEVPHVGIIGLHSNRLEQKITTSFMVFGRSGNMIRVEKGNPMGPDREQISFSLRSKGFIKNESGEWVKANSVATRIPNSELKPDLHGTLEQETQAKPARNGLVNICFTLIRTRLLDWDNAAGSCKIICDTLKKCGAIQDDSPSHIEVTVKQKKVAHRKDEGTLIEVIYP